MSEIQDEETINQAKEVRKLTWEAFLKKYESKFKKQLSPSTFVIIASMSLFDRIEKTIKIVSIGFGTKSLPHSLIEQNNSEDLLVDMHAQILAIRAFRRFLLKKIIEKDQYYLQSNEKKSKFKIKDKYSVILYCSQIFCGDCCINQNQASFSGAKPLKYLQAQKYPELKYEPNVLRTKPGRLDLPVEKRSHLLSCSDKLAFYNLVGIQGSKLFQTLLPVYLDLIIVQSQNTMKENIIKGIDFVQRLQHISKKSEKLIERQIFKIVLNQHQRKITNQFYRNIPCIIVLQKSQKHNRDQEGFQLCGIICQQSEEWINGKTGLPEGCSLKNYKNKGKISLFCESRLKTYFENYKQGNDYFKYDAIEYRLKKLFGQWISPD